MARSTPSVREGPLFDGQPARRDRGSPDSVSRSRRRAPPTPRRFDVREAASTVRRAAGTGTQAPSWSASDAAITMPSFAGRYERSGAWALSRAARPPVR